VSGRAGVLGGRREGDGQGRKSRKNGPEKKRAAAGHCTACRGPRGRPHTKTSTQQLFERSEVIDSDRRERNDFQFLTGQTF